MREFKASFYTRKRPEHTHFLLSDGTITPIERFPGMREGDIIIFKKTKPLSAKIGEDPIKSTFEKPYIAEELEIVGFLIERRGGVMSSIKRKIIQAGDKPGAIIKLTDEEWKSLLPLDRVCSNCKQYREGEDFNEHKFNFCKLGYYDEAAGVDEDFITCQMWEAK